MIKKLLQRIPLDRVNWITSIFLMGTLGVALTMVPWYIWCFGLNWFQISLFFVFYMATGLSITLGYHRLLSHLSFKAKLPVKLFVLLFGAAAFENSALDWCSDHRNHHKHVDGDDDPYDISKGFWFAHIGWLLFKLKPEPPMDNVGDLQKDHWIMWQHHRITILSVLMGFVLPTLIAWCYGGWQAALGGFLIAGVARIVAVQQSTFCINSLCHTVGDRPYSSKCSARDSWIAALVTFGEGYHNFHHEFQHDYRNGVKPWQFDPTKWTIWCLSKVRLVSNLRRVPDAKILLAEIIEARRQIDSGLGIQQSAFPESMRKFVIEYQEKLEILAEKFNEVKAQLQSSAIDKIEISREVVDQWRRDIQEGVQAVEWLLKNAVNLRKGA